MIVIVVSIRCSEHSLTLAEIVSESDGEVGVSLERLTCVFKGPTGYDSEVPYGFDPNRMRIFKDPGNDAAIGAILNLMALMTFMLRQIFSIRKSDLFKKLYRS
jgi:hypothetical protein